MKNNFYVNIVFGLMLSLFMTACQPVAQPPTQQSDPTQSSANSLIIYSGRNENLVGPLLDRFATESGIKVEVRYGGTAEMAATIMEEGANSPADVYYGQDAGALGALAQAGRLSQLPQEILSQVDGRFVSDKGLWVGTSGRARTLVYNTDELSESDLPQDIWGLTDPTWRGRVGWAPTNGSFQAFVTALRVLEGEEQARSWLEAMIANDAQSYAENTPIVAAAGAGEISVGLVNHYYLYRFLAEQGESFPARNYYFPAGDAGAMINVAGVGIIDSAPNQANAEKFVAFLLSQESQQYFADETDEYPVAGQEIQMNTLIKPLADIRTPDLDLSDLVDLQGTLQLLQDVGALD